MPVSRVRIRLQCRRSMPACPGLPEPPPRRVQRPLRVQLSRGQHPHLRQEERSRPQRLQLHVAQSAIHQHDYWFEPLLKALGVATVLIWRGGRGEAWFELGLRMNNGFEVVFKDQAASVGSPDCVILPGGLPADCQSMA